MAPGGFCGPKSTISPCERQLKTLMDQTPEPGSLLQTQAFDTLQYLAGSVGPRSPTHPNTRSALQPSLKGGPQRSRQLACPYARITPIDPISRPVPQASHYSSTPKTPGSSITLVPGLFPWPQLLGRLHNNRPIPESLD